MTMLYFYISLGAVLVAGVAGWFSRKYYEEDKTLYYFTEEELAHVYKELWEKGRTLGIAKSNIIPTQEFLDLQFSIDKNETIQKYRKSK